MCLILITSGPDTSLYPKLEPEITLAAALNVFVLKNGRIASSIFGPMVVDIDDYVGRLGRAGSFNNIHNTVATLVEDVADLMERVAVLED